MKSIKIITDITYFDKELVKYYPNITLSETLKLKSLIYNAVSNMNVDDIKNELYKQIPIIHDMIDWDLYYEILLIESYINNFREKTGLTGLDLIQKICENLSYADYKKLTDTMADQHYPALAKEFKKHFSEELLKHKTHLERPKKLKRILK